MAQRRMIDKKISVSEQVSNLPIAGQLLFTWMVPHADDLGLLPYSTKTIKALVVPLLDISLESIGNLLEDIVSNNLIEVWEYEGEKFYRIRKFLRNQTLKRDRKPNTLAKNINNWEDVESLGFQMEDNGNPSKVKRSKVKLSKDILPTIVGKATKLPNPDIDKIIQTLKNETGLQELDGSKQGNRRYAYLLIQKWKDCEKICQAIKLGSQSDWHKSKMTSTKYLYYHLADMAREQLNKVSKVAVINTQ